MIAIEGLSKRFQDNLPFALQPMSLQLTPGKIIGVIGPDGAGKTTLLRLLTGLLLPTSGSIHKENLSSIGYMPQKFGLYEDLTVLENLELYADLQGVLLDEKKGIFKTLLSFSGLSPFTTRLARDLSGGMKQKLGLACALLKKPKLLLLDEPTVGVDPISRRELWEMMKSILQKEMVILWSTAYLDEAEKCDEVLLLQEGKLLFFGKPSDLIQQYGSLEKVFMTQLDAPSFSVSETKIVQTIKHPIIAENLTKKFGSFTAAKKISFQVKKGEIFGLLGPNGAGKSTVFKMLCGLLTPTDGRAWINGLGLQETPSEARRSIGYMAQKFSLYGNLTLLQNLELFGNLYCKTKKEKKRAIEQSIQSFKLTQYVDQIADLLPIGLKQRLSFAAATLHSPAVLFLDEPTSGMDPLARHLFWEQIQHFAKLGCTVMVTTHFLDEAEYCDRIALLYQSEMIYLGTSKNLKKQVISKDLPNPTLDDAFIEFIRRKK